MNSSKFKPKDSNTSIKKFQSNSEIDVLYKQFECLKSQIYGVKRQPQAKHIQVSWSNYSNKSKAVEMLRQSTIHKCQQQLQQNLSLIQSSQPKIKQNLFKRSIQQPDVVNLDYVKTNGEEMSRNYSKKFKEYEEMPSVNFEESGRESNFEEEIGFTDGEELFRQFLNKVQRPPIMDLSASKRSSVQQQTFLIPQIQNLLASIADDHLKKLNFLLQTLTFMSQKLYCLEMIIEQYGKIIKAKFQSIENQAKQRSQLILNVSAIESKYQEQIKKLNQFYQHELKKQSSKLQKKQHVKFQPNNTALEQTKNENKRLNQLLTQAQLLIKTKEELINALNEQNQELKEQVDKLKKHNQIRYSADSSLGYSGTAQKHVKRRDSQGDMQQIGNKLKRALEQGDKPKWDEFQQGSNNDINYSQLQSVKDKSLDDWDISNLQLQTTSKISRNKDELQ